MRILLLACLVAGGMLTALACGSSKAAPTATSSVEATTTVVRTIALPTAPPQPTATSTPAPEPATATPAPDVHAIATEPTTAPVVPVPTTPTPTCGEHASLTLTGPSLIGRTFHAGESLTVQFDYTAPGCVNGGATVYGFSKAGSPNYQYWCVEHKSQTPPRLCEAGHFEAAIIADQEKLPGESGSLVLTTNPGAFPPDEPDPGLATPPIEGFVPCALHVVLDNGVIAGPAFVRDFGTIVPGAPCSQYHGP